MIHEKPQRIVRVHNNLKQEIAFLENLLPESMHIRRI